MHALELFAPTEEENEPFAHMDGVDILDEEQNVPAGHEVGDFKPSAPQKAPAGQSRQLLLLTARVVGWNVPAAHLSLIHI